MTDPHTQQVAEALAELLRVAASQNEWTDDISPTQCDLLAAYITPDVVRAINAAGFEGHTIGRIEPHKDGVPKDEWVRIWIHRPQLIGKIAAAALAALTEGGEDD